MEFVKMERVKNTIYPPGNQYSTVYNHTMDTVDIIMKPLYNYD